jgi:transposase
MENGTEVSAAPTLAAFLGPALTESQAREIFRQGEEAVVFALLELAKRLAEQQAAAVVPSPATPSGMRPGSQKPPAPQRRQKPGRPKGHPGMRRPPPARIDQRKVHRLKCCPHCHGPVRQGRRCRTRYTEDIPTGIQPVVTEHTIYRAWCPRRPASFRPG